MIELEKIHIGKLVLKRMQERGWKVKTLARNIGKTETATYKILGKKQLHTSVMVMLCKALRYNFFCECCTEDLPDVKGREEKISALEKRVKELEDEKKMCEMEFVKRENELLKKMVG